MLWLLLLQFVASEVKGSIGIKLVGEREHEACLGSVFMGQAHSISLAGAHTGMGRAQT